MKIDVKRIDEIVCRYERSEESLLAILQDFQREFSYIPKEGIKRLSEIFDVPVSRLYAMGTFYKSLSLVPRGRHTIKVCTGTACYLKGERLILEAIERGLDIDCGDTTEDMRFTIETVNCLGTCAMAPVMVVDDEYYGQPRPSEIMVSLKKYK